MADFIQDYFINPILYQDKYAPYNPFNTVAYALIALVAVYLIFKALKHFNVKIDEGFAKSVLPFVLFGAALRVLEDGKILPRVVDFLGIQLYPFVTPGIYIFTFILLGVSAAASILIAGRGNAKKLLTKIGLVLALIPFLLVVWHVKFALNGLAIIGLAFVLLKSFEYMFKRFAKRDLSFFESAAFYGQVLDGCATFISIQFGTPAAQYVEQHVVGGALISGLGPISFLLLKIVFASLVIYFLKDEKNQEEKNYVLLLIAIFGFGPGTRDLLRLAAGV